MELADYVHDPCQPRLRLCEELKVPKLEPEVDFSVATFTFELAKYLNYYSPSGCGPPSNPTSNLSPAAACAASPCTLPHPCSRRANLTIHTCLLAQGWRSTSALSIVNKRSFCLVLQVRPRSDPSGLVLRSSKPLAGVRALMDRARRVLLLKKGSRTL